MKNLFKTVVSGMAVAVGYFAGKWLWEDVIQGKIQDYRDYRKAKKEEK